ncbi:hypothetical protein ACMA1I_08125 [Pontibacter sp. 13R65]|uniref:hypothetical protein n=1 Tax=Pontibacter sp. 13R65 TaxID=3127458 RepID=UPI00301D0E4E
MENNNEKTIQSLMEEPEQVKEIINDPSKGIDFYKKLPLKQKQYLLYAAAAGLIGYSIYLGKKGA